jgi:hypothetical protein
MGWDICDELVHDMETVINLLCGIIRLPPYINFPSIFLIVEINIAESKFDLFLPGPHHLFPGVFLDVDND